MRELSTNFLNDLMNTNGFLQPIFERVKKDHTLMFAIRDGYINIYYRGGNLIKVQEQSKGSYRSSFHNGYNKDGKTLPILPPIINSQEDAKSWVNAFPHLKEIMDLFFAINSKPEREFQQLVARENNFSTISNQSEYFISDIEFANSELRARIDMLAIRWLASKRKDGSNCRPALIEMKYADGAFEGNAGLHKHLKDMDSLILNRKRYEDLLTTMESQFNQLDNLGLLNFTRSSRGTKVKFDADVKPEVIIILANHNPRSSKLSTVLSNPNIGTYEHSPNFDLKFYVASFAGYALHANCMLTLSQFRELLKSKNAKQSATQNGYSAALYSPHT
jgi:hypothetical protein